MLGDDGSVHRDLVLLVDRSWHRCSARLEMSSRSAKFFAVTSDCVGAWFSTWIVLTYDGAWLPCSLDGVVYDDWFARQELTFVEASTSIVVLRLVVLALLVYLQVAFLVAVTVGCLPTSSR